MRLLALATSAAMVMMTSQVFSASSAMIPFPGDPKVDTLIVPAASPVKFSSFGQYQVAKFSRQFQLSGEYYYGHLGLVDERPNELSLYIRPDRDTRASLPHWKVRGGPENIYITNADDFAKVVVPGDLLAKLHSRKLLSVRGHVSIIATDYKVWIECDSPNYSARFIALTLANELVAMTQPENFGCG